MSKSKSLVPLAKSVGPERYRRRGIGFVLVLIGLVILIPNWQDKHPDEVYSEQWQRVKSKSQNLSSMDTQSIEAKNNEVQQSPVQNLSLQASEQAPWQNNYDESLQASESFKANESLQSAWIVQVASFNEPGKAEQLIARLKAGGYRAEIMPRLVKDHYVYRVMVGPQLRREEADLLLPLLKKTFAVNPIVRTYTP